MYDYPQIKLKFQYDVAEVNIFNLTQAYNYNHINK